MKIIPLTFDQFALIDNKFFKQVSQYNWHCVQFERCRYAAKGIRKPNGQKAKLMMHNFIYMLSGIEVPIGYVLDHIDGNGLNNQLSNLRLANAIQNSSNYPHRTPNSRSGYFGVVWRNKPQKWAAVIDHNKKKYYGGTFVDPKDAAIARDDLAIKLHGEFAVLNFPERLVKS